MLINYWCTQIHQTLENNIIRLHIVANSDSEYDRGIKLKVRDAVLELAGESGCTPTVAEIEKEANKLLLNEGAPYTASARSGKYYIDRRIYEGFILPRGVYTAARIELGNAMGKNWWCVLSPPLCFTKSAFGHTDELRKHLGQDAYTVVKHSKVTVKLKLLEIISALKN